MNLNKHRLAMFLPAGVHRLLQQWENDTRVTKELGAHGVGDGCYSLGLVYLVDKRLNRRDVLLCQWVTTEFN